MPSTKNIISLISLSKIPTGLGALAGSIAVLAAPAFKKLVGYYDNLSFSDDDTFSILLGYPQMLLDQVLKNTVDLLDASFDAAQELTPQQIILFCATLGFLYGIYKNSSIFQTQPQDEPLKPYTWNQDRLDAVEFYRQNIPEHYICPITRFIMTNPAIAEDGYSYEYAAIQKWLFEHKTSPKQNTPFKVNITFLNKQLSTEINNFVNQIEFENNGNEVATQFDTKTMACMSP